jgi:hypothetical protein
VLSDCWMTICQDHFAMLNKNEIPISGELASTITRAENSSTKILRMIVMSSLSKRDCHSSERGVANCAVQTTMC